MVVSSCVDPRLPAHGIADSQVSGMGGEVVRGSSWGLALSPPEQGRAVPARLGQNSAHFCWNVLSLFSSIGNLCFSDCGTDFQQQWEITLPLINRGVLASTLAVSWLSNCSTGNLAMFDFHFLSMPPLLQIPCPKECLSAFIHMVFCWLKAFVICYHQ